MGEVSDRITEELKAAMRSQDSVALAVLRGLKAAIKNAAIEKGGADAELTDAEVLVVVRKQVKQRQDSIEAFASAGRTDLEDKEKAEVVVLEKFLPAELSEAELGQIVDAVIAATGATSRKEMGKVMGMLQQKVAGRADNRTLSQMVQGRLG